MSKVRKWLKFKVSGFTLVELLAIIAILGIIAIVVVPSVFSTIKKGKDNSYNILIDSFEENARLYVTRYRDEVEVGFDLNNYDNNITIKNGLED